LADFVSRVITVIRCSKATITVGPHVAAVLAAYYNDTPWVLNAIGMVDNDHPFMFHNQ
jgi:hypothetical protein